MIMIKNNEKAIQEAAYFIWQNAGCPQGQDEYFWSMAVEQINNSCKKSCSSKKSSSCKVSASSKTSSSKKSTASVKSAKTTKTAKKSK
ncbi:MAG: DUF2934 domain-containing protein [Alphaproteobacteria bacterium]|nr:DUF2934 domain-containing protein [Alphaproteobacteria bacterium]